MLKFLHFNQGLYLSPVCFSDNPREDSSPPAEQVVGGDGGVGWGGRLRSRRLRRRGPDEEGD